MTMNEWDKTQTETAKAAFAKDGYLLIPGALPPGPCSDFGAAVIAEYDRLLGAGWSFSGSGKLAGNLNIRMGTTGRALFEAFTKAGLPDLIAQLTDEPLEFSQAVGNFNLPGSCMQDFHMDGSFDRPVLIANICLVPTDKANGATEIVPQSHQADMSYWRFTHDGWRARVIQPAVQPGDVLIRPSNLWHRGTPNHSASPRPMAAFAWTPRRFLQDGDICADLDGPLTIFANKYYGRFKAVKEFVAARLPVLDEALRLGKAWLDDQGRGH
jgi:hypothetical protein